MKSKRKIFICCVMSLMMALVMAVPMSVSAAEKPVTDKAGLLEAINNAANGDVITVSGNIECDTAVNIDDNITITGGSITFNTPGVNSMTIVDGAEVDLNNIKIANTDGKSVIHVYGSTLTAENLTVVHGGSTGAPILVNNGSTADFTGLNLELGANSWYGVNVDGSEATFSGVTTNGTTGTQSVVCAENNADVTCPGYTVVKTNKDGGNNQPQTAYVADSNLAEFVAKKTEGNKDITEIDLDKNVNLSAPLYLNEEMTVNGNGYTITGPVGIEENAVTIKKSDVTLNDLKIETTEDNKSALHVYKSENVTLNNITLDNTKTVGGAGLIVNGSTVDIAGQFKVILGEKSWGGINVDTTNGDAEVNFLDGSKVVAEGIRGDQSVIYQDENDTEEAVINGADKAGLVENADGSYSIAGTDSTDPSTTPGTDTPSGDKTDATPQTGDDTNLGLMFAIMGIAAAAAAGTLVYGRRRHNN